MTDVRTSNARRIGFTALALVVFWVMAWRVYLAEFDIRHGFAPGLESLLSRVSDPICDVLWKVLDAPYPIHTEAFVMGSLALIPTALISLSRHNRPFTFRDWRLLVSGVLLWASLSLVFWRSFLDVEESYDAAYMEIFGSPRPHGYTTSPIFRRSYEHPITSWLTLLLPIILTTAFVIVGAWRSAVRDAVVEPEGEDE